MLFWGSPQRSTLSFQRTEMYPQTFDYKTTWNALKIVYSKNLDFLNNLTGKMCI